MNKLFILYTKDLNKYEVLSKATLLELNRDNADLTHFKKSSFIDEMTEKLTIKSTMTGDKLCLKYKKIRISINQGNDNNQEEIPAKKDSLSTYLKFNPFKLLSSKSCYDIISNELKLILQYIKIFEIKGNDYNCFISVFFHKVIEYWTLILLFPHNCRKFAVNIHFSDITSIPKENLEEICFENPGEIAEVDIWKYLLKMSVISSNREGSSFLEVFNIKVIIREIIDYGFEILEASNSFTFYEVSIKSKDITPLRVIQEVWRCLI